MRSLVAALVFVALAAGCSHRLASVGLNYDSNSHLHPREVVREVRGTPSEVMARIVAFAKEHGAHITENQPSRPPTGVQPVVNAEERWAAIHAIFAAEWHAFEVNDIRLVQKIDRSSPLLRPTMGKADGLPTLHILRDVTDTHVFVAQFPSRKGAYTHTVDITTAGPPASFQQTEQVDVSSVFHALTWADAAGRTWVYMSARPRFGNLEGPGSAVPYSLWTVTTGIEEARLVTSVFEALER